MIRVKEKFKLREKPGNFTLSSGKLKCDYSNQATWKELTDQNVT